MPNQPSKKDVCRAILLQGQVFVHLDPRKDRVLVPARLRNQYQVVLHVALDMEIPDLRLDDYGLLATLSFKGVPFTCFLPWDAVFALVGQNQRGMIWNQDMPAELIKEMAESEQQKAATQTLNVVRLDTTKAKTSRPVITRKSGPYSAPKANHLRVVK